MEKSRVVDNLLICGIAPYFLEKGSSWFEENKGHILKATKTQPFWQDNVLYLEKNQTIKISEVLRKLDEMGYEKVFKADSPGEFSQTGGVVDVFPVNVKNSFRLDFLGNNLENIEQQNQTIKDENTSRTLLKKKLKRQKIFSDIRGIKPGNYLVHLDHGVGRFLGMEGARLLPGNRKEPSSFYVLQYAKGDKLYVPLGLERKLSKYIGFVEPKLSRLGGVAWQRTKKKIKEETEKFAKELLTLFAQKEVARREPYSRKELSELAETDFKFNLTPDQKGTLKELEKDLLKEEPLDRVICGDVGFGKTEIALRLAVRAAENNKQAALITPTTILASQHFENFQKRLLSFPFNLKILSRLQPKAEQTKTKAGLRGGDVDIVVGTHSLLAKNIVFKNLGMLIIDDEQKFGVKQKEALRQKYPALDVVCLSATPIPRTLYMALSSLKKISFIQTPPEGRKPIKTFILPFEKEVIKKAVLAEIKRKGQVYFLHNRVETILGFKKYLESFLPELKIAVLHAKLPEKEIIKTLTDFQARKTNILLSTTIIENGIDLANVNTLIVDNAVKLGLSQAYQIRGRVGRSEKQAFAYFLYNKKTLKGKAKQRLKALKEAQELGSGYKIATADLEIRGAGNILGKEQSGAVNRVGLNLYCQMLSEAVEKYRSSAIMR